MGNLTEREETTDYAKKRIRSFIKGNEHHLALLIANIYADIRLRSILTDYHITPKGDNLKDEKWKKKANKLKSRTFKSLLNDCEKLGLLDNKELKDLDNLRKKRNDVAHESRLWKDGLSANEEKEINEVCESAIDFMENHELINH